VLTVEKMPSYGCHQDDAKSSRGGKSICRNVNSLMFTLGKGLKTKKKQG